MASSRSEYVTDANVLIDLHFGRVLEALFLMPAVFVAPDVIVAELENPSGRSLMKAGLRQESLPGEGVCAAVELMAEDSHVSVQDAFALALAERSGRVLLTGEKRLRELAQRRGVEVHGTLWVLEQMIAKGTLTRGRAADALETMLESGCRLPETEARNLVRRWRTTKECD